MNQSITEPKFKHRLLANFFVRFHMTLILGAICLSGVTISKLLLEIGIKLMLPRYLIAVCCAYAVFFLMMRLWLWHVGVSPRSRKLVLPNQKRRSDGSYSDEISFDISDISSGSASDDSLNWSGFGGGSSGGGGASDNWGETPASGWLSSSSPSPTTSGSSYQWGSATSNRSGGSGFDLDFGDDGCLGIVVLLLLVALALAIFGAGAYLIYQAPAILAETAFQAALASGLVKASKGMDDPDWKGSVFKATWLPFVIVLTLALTFSIAAHSYCPAATKATEVFTACQ